MIDRVQPSHAHLAVLGSPIAHSRSPRIHRAAYDVLGLPWEYEAIECEEAGLAALLDGSDAAWLGFSVTMPLKAEAHRLSAVLDPVAEESGVANTLLRVLGQGSKPAWAGFNTDVFGLAAAISEAGLDATDTVVIGSGATAMSAILAARRLGALRVTVAARNVETAAALARRFDGSRERDGGVAVSVAAVALSASAQGELAAALEKATLVISTLPGPAAPSTALPAGATRVPLLDVAYDPWPSPLAVRWRVEGGIAHSGVGMLVHQALAQLRIFVNGDPGRPVEREHEVFAAMRRAGGTEAESG